MKSSLEVSGRGERGSGVMNFRVEREREVYKLWGLGSGDVCLWKIEIGRQDFIWRDSRAAFCADVAAPIRSSIPLYEVCTLKSARRTRSHQNSTVK